MLRKQVSTKGEEWLSACNEVQEQLNKAKEDSWKDLSANTSDDESKIWSFIKTLKGRPEANSPNEVMIHNDRAITSNKKKADLFANHYSAISRHRFSRDYRAVNRDLKIRLRSDFVDNAYSQNFTITELRRALSKMKRRGTQGPDDIPPVPAGTRFEGTARVTGYI